jgi:dienelactone hydrolase
MARRSRGVGRGTRDRRPCGLRGQLRHGRAACGARCDSYTSPAQVAELDEILSEEDKPHEFHSYDHAGHDFFAVDQPSYRVAAANDGWERIAAFYANHLGGWANEPT